MVPGADGEVARESDGNAGELGRPDRAWVISGGENLSLYKTELGWLCTLCSAYVFFVAEGGIPIDILILDKSGTLSVQTSRDSAVVCTYMIPI